jgi:hypothetical protein
MCGSPNGLYGQAVNHTKRTAALTRACASRFVKSIYINRPPGGVVDQEAHFVPASFQVIGGGERGASPPDSLYHWGCRSALRCHPSEWSPL